LARVLRLGLEAALFCVGEALDLIWHCVSRFSFGRLFLFSESFERLALCSGNYHGEGWLLALV
jgi:hypothetical protein